mmetsp:Transcript_3290/g.3911  ORF Transcript_3290/g.3911 Transcript_3290/m.3911 type:complete len:308 (-) Transcript_3290:167-1090(-)
MAKQFGLGVSFLERLSQLPVYSRDSKTLKFPEKVITKLVRNYRSHESILKVPNRLFYDNELQKEADPFLSDSLEQWEQLPTKGFPIIFHGVEGEDKREGNSPSWFNPEEAMVVRNYVDLLVRDTKRNRVPASSIGIVTPYQKQVQKIRQLMGAHGYSDCTVGSVEQFQGSERRVIIVSTVRSSVEYMEFDTKYQLGFLSNSKRFNVAITRAQALLIVVGNPKVLSRDPCWNAFLNYCIEHGGYTGCEYSRESEKEGVEDDVLDALLSSCVRKESDGVQDGVESNGSDDFIMISHTTAQEGPAWRQEE